MVKRFFQALFGANSDKQAQAAALKGLREQAPHLAIRYLELDGMRVSVRKTVKQHGLEPVMYDQLVALDDMVAAYMRLAQEYARYRAYIERSPVRMVEKELERTRARLAERPDEVLAQNLEVLEARLTKAKEIEATTQRLKNQLDVLEDTVHLIREQSLTASSPEDLHVDFDRVRSGIAATDAALAETRALMRGASAEMR